MDKESKDSAQPVESENSILIRHFLSVYKNNNNKFDDNNTSQ